MKYVILYPNLQKEIYKRALNKWDKFTTDKASLSIFDLSIDLSKNSHASLDRLLKDDKRYKRKDISKVAPLFKEAINISNIHLPARFWHKLK